MNRKKSIATAIVLALVLIIGGMLAYFTDTDSKKNEFTLGDNVDIKLEETFNPNDALGIQPGAVVNKAPKIVNESTTTPAYVFAEVIVPCYDVNGGATGTTPSYSPLFTLNNIGEGWIKISSDEVADASSKTITYIYAWGTATGMTELAASTETVQSKTSNPVFSSVTLVSTLTKEQKATANAEPNIDVNAYGIQIDNLGKTAPLDIYHLIKPAN